MEELHEKMQLHEPRQIVKFEDVPLEEKIHRLYLTVKELRRDLGYQIRRTHSLERKIQALEMHEHGSAGEVMIKIKNTYHNEGSDCCSAAPDLLA